MRTSAANSGSGLKISLTICLPSNNQSWRDEVASPRPKHNRGGDEIKRLLTGLVHYDEQNLTIGSTPGPQPHIAAARCMQTLLPGPMVGLDQVRAFDLAPVLKREGIGAFALHQQGALMRARHIAHQLGVAEP